MVSPHDDEAEDDVLPGEPSDEDLAEIESVDDGELSLDALEDIEEDENAGHRVVTFDGRDDGERYFDGAYFDE